MKLCMSHYAYKIIPDAKFEAGSFSSFEDITSQNALGRREKAIKFGYLPRKTGLAFKHEFVSVQNCSSRPKIVHECQF